MPVIETISLKGLPFEDCPECGTRLRFAYRSNKHEFRALTGWKRTYTCYYKCENDHKFSPPNPWVFPKKEFGIDVYALVNYYRHKKKRTLEEIKELLQEGYQIAIAPESIRSMVLTYQILNHEYISPEKIKAMQAHQGVILAIDALDPTKGADPLYVVRDQLTGTILASCFIYSASEEVLVPFLSELKAKLKALQIPILGIISDKLRGQEKAIEAVFPEVPHQLCIYHFLRAAAEPATKWDMHLATQLKKALNRNYYLYHYKKNDAENRQ